MVALPAAFNMSDLSESDRGRVFHPVLHCPEGPARSAGPDSRTGGWPVWSCTCGLPGQEPAGGRGRPSCQGARWLPQGAGRVSRPGLTVFLGGHEVVSGAVTRQEARAGFSPCGHLSRPGRKVRVWALGGSVPARLRGAAEGAGTQDSRKLVVSGGRRLRLELRLEAAWMEPAPRPAPVPRRSGPYARPVRSAQQWRRHRPVCPRSTLGIRGGTSGATSSWAGTHSPSSRLDHTTAPTMSLDIQFQQLTDAGWTELLPQIQQCPVVRIEDCGLTEPRCRDVSTALQANPALTELSLDLNELGDAGVGLVLQGLQSPGCQLRKLSLQTCCLTEAGCGVLPSALRAMPSLRELQLSDNALGDAGLQLLCQGLLDAQCYVERLRLEYCKLSAASCEALASVLRAKPGFKELALGNNDLGEAGVRALCRGLKDSASQLEVLKLESCGVTTANCRELAESVVGTASLQELHLGDNPLGDAGLAALCPGLLQPGSRLQTLWLWDCGLTAKGCRDLGSLLKAKDSLKELSVSGNALGDEGARLLCEALLEPSCRLQSLWVKSCNLTAACCPHFGSMLGQNRSLLELQLSSNQLGDAGVQALCQGLRQPGCMLQVLCLGDCDVSDGGCGSLASVLLVSPSLQKLDLSNNCMGDPGLLQLLDSARQPACTLQYLILYDIYWTQEMEEQLQALEKARPALRVIC